MQKIELALNTLKFAILTTSIVIVWFEILNVQFRLKKLLKIPLHEFTKPFDCRLCTHIWIGSFMAIGLSFVNLQLGIYLFIINIFTSYIYEISSRIRK